MELGELRSFCTAAELRSISKAAERLGIGQPTVTTHIRKLESELGTMLFDRVRRPIQLTSSGAALSRLATPLVKGIDELATSTSAAEAESPVSIASTQDIIPHALLRVVRVFERMYPHTRFRIRSGIVPDVFDMVKAGEVDMGVAPAPPRRPEDFEFVALFAYERVLITPLGHPLLATPLTSLDRIAEWPLILRTEGTHTRAMLEGQFRRKGLRYEILVELDSMDMIKRYVALGMGVSVGGRLAMEPEDQNTLGIVSLANLLPVEQVGIVTLRGKTLSTPTRNFISVLRDTLSYAGSRRGKG